MQHFIAQIIGNLLKHFAQNDQLVASILETALPEEAPIIALADGVYQAYKKNPAALDGLVVPFSIGGVAYKSTITKA